MLETSARLLALLSLLQLRQAWTGQQLADRLEVEPRTIRRDVNKLRSLGYPVEASAGAAGGYRLGAGCTVPPLVLDDAEAVAVAVGLRTAASIAGIERTSLHVLAKLDQMLPRRLRHRVRALAEATSTIEVDGRRIDAETLATLAGACRAYERVCLIYLSATDQISRRHVEPNALVHSGYRWYLVAYDLDRDDWRTFRVDRIRGPVTVGAQGTPREVPGGDAASYVQRVLGSPANPGHQPGRVRLTAPAAEIGERVPRRYATVEPDGAGACVVTSRGGWSRAFLVHVALLEYPMTVLGPPDLATAAQMLAARLTPAA